MSEPVAQLGRRVVGAEESVDHTDCFRKSAPDPDPGFPAHQRVAVALLLARG